jgi:hypothetical protein
MTRPKKPSARPYIPPEDRVHGTRRYRGPEWTDVDDHVLRNWFAVRTLGPHKGKRVPLTEEQWAGVLTALGGRRSKTEVLSRIATLNKRLRESLMVDDVMPRVNVDRYLREALGERTLRAPKARPRLRYDYRQDN